MKPYHNYFFDLDGTLVDTIDLVVKCFEKSLGENFQINKSREELLQYVGLPLKNQFEFFLKDILVPIDYEALCRFHMDYQLQIWKQFIRLYPGVLEALDFLKQHNKKLAIVTSRRLKTTTLYLKELGLFDFFDVIITPEDTKQHKPHPEPLFKALSALKAKANDSLFIGDSNFDMLCAKQAGVDQYFVLWGFGKEANLSLKPTYIKTNLKPLFYKGK